MTQEVVEMGKRAGLKVELWDEQMRNLTSDQLLAVIEDCERRVGSHVIQSEVPCEQYIAEQRAIARLAVLYL